ncbi:MAG: sensor histidine kinase [Candidatus Heimdallarchaeaceae archaeon]
MNKIFVNHSFLAPLILGSIALFLKEEQVRVYYTRFTITLIVTMLITYITYIIFKKEENEKGFFIFLDIAMIFFFIDELTDSIKILLYRSIYPDFSEISRLIGELVVCTLLISRIISDFNKIKEILPIFLVLIIISTLVYFSFLFSTFENIFEETKIKTVTFLFLLVDSFLFGALLLLVIFYIHLHYGIYWLALLTGFAFFILGDLSFALTYFLDITLINGLHSCFYIIAYSSLLSFLIWARFSKYKPQSIARIEKERKILEYKNIELTHIINDILAEMSFFRHDIANDVTAITGFMDVYLETKEPKYLRLLQERINNLADKLECFYLSVNKSNHTLEEIPISYLYEVSSLFKNVLINIPKTNNDIKIMASKLLYPITYNIIQNAYQHGGNNINVEIDVVTSERKGKNKVEIHIKDNGKGMKEEEKENVFSLLYKNSETGGHGLALFLARYAIERMNGTIEVKDNKPQGTIFIITLDRV